jgi:hypothetical protein
MDYKRQYDLLMEKARQRGTVEGYKERHHIIPRCMGGSNAKDNIVELTAREHYVAHRLLYMIHGTQQMARAWISMTRRTTKQDRIYTNRQYERARLEWSEVQRGKKRPTWIIEKMNQARKEKGISEETRKKYSTVRLGIPRTEECKQNISKALKGKPKSESHKEKLRQLATPEWRRAISERNKGVPKTAEHKAKCRAAALLREERKRIDKELEQLDVLLDAANSL